MDLPESMRAIGEQLAAGGAVAPPPELFDNYDVFRSEIGQLCVRPWLAVDHASRLGADGDYFRVEIGSRSVVVVRETEDRVFALRNACLHAGYRVCDEEAGRGDSLFCRYHGWSYALDGTLTDPLLRPEQTDRSRYRLPRYPIQIAGGLIFVDMSVVGPTAPDSTPLELGDLPALAGWPVAGRKRYPAALNWKYLRQRLWADKGLALGRNGLGHHGLGRDGYDGVAEFGPLSYVVWRGDEAALLRLVPRFPGQSEIELVRLGDGGTAASVESEALAEKLRRTGEAVSAAPLAQLDRAFYDWYWSALHAEPAH